MLELFSTQPPTVTMGRFSVRDSEDAMSKKKIAADPMFVDLVRDNPNGLQYAFEKGGIEMVREMIRNNLKRGVHDQTMVRRIFACEERRVIFRWYARMRLKGESWRSFVDAIVDLPDRQWEDIGLECTEWVLKTVLTADVLGYIWKHRRRAIANPRHPLFDRIRFDACHRANIQRLLANGDDRRAWDEAQNACRGLPCEVLDGGAVANDERDLRCHQADRVTLMILVALIFDHLVGKNRMSELRTGEILMEQMQNGTEPLLMAVISGEKRNGHPFQYYREAVMAYRLHEYYRLQRNAQRLVRRQRAARAKTRAERASAHR
jgi:hypothetical protein